MSHPTPPASSGPLLPRRGFFAWLTYLTGAAAAAVLAVPFVGYLIGPVLKRREKWVTLGPVSDFPKGEYRLATFVNKLEQPWDGMVANTGAYVRYQGKVKKDNRETDDFLIFAVNCAHLGCPVSWFPQSGLFMCPCHGGVYYENGDHASGPPPRGLFHCVWRVRDGLLEIQAPHYPTLHDTLRGDSA